MSSDRDFRCGAVISASLSSAVGEAALTTVTNPASSLDAVSSAVLATKAIGVSKTTASRIYSAAAERIKAASVAQLLDISTLPAVLDALVVFRQEDLFADLVAEVFEKGFQLLPSGDGGHVSDPLLVWPLSQLTDKKLRLIGARLLAVTESLLALRHSAHLPTLSRALDALNYITTYKFNPVHISLQSRSFPSSSSSSGAGSSPRQLAVRVVDSLGRVAEVASAEVASVKPVGASASAAGGAGREYFQGSRLEPSSADGGLLLLDMSGEELLPGKYAVHLSVTVAGHSKAVSFQGFFVISREVRVTGVVAGVADSASPSSSALQAVRAQNALAEAELTASAAAGEYLHVQYEVSAAAPSAAGGGSLKKPHQSFVRLTLLEPEGGAAGAGVGDSFYFVGKRESSEEGVCPTVQLSQSFFFRNLLLSVLLGCACIRCVRLSEQRDGALLVSLWPLPAEHSGGRPDLRLARGVRGGPRLAALPRGPRVPPAALRQVAAARLGQRARPSAGPSRARTLTVHSSYRNPFL